MASDDVKPPDLSVGMSPRGATVGVPAREPKGIEFDSESNGYKTATRTSAVSAVRLTARSRIEDASAS